MKTLSAAVLLLVGCSQHTVEPGWQPLGGTEYLTPRGFSFWWMHGTSRYRTPEETGLEIDRLYVEWNAWYTAKYHVAQPWTLLAKLLTVDIQLMPWSEIPGNDEDAVEVGIYWEEHRQIDIAMASRLRYDGWIEAWSSGIEGLRHEWTHVIRGASHD